MFITEWTAAALSRGCPWMVIRVISWYSPATAMMQWQHNILRSCRWLSYWTVWYPFLLVRLLFHLAVFFLFQRGIFPKMDLGPLDIFFGRSSSTQPSYLFSQYLLQRFGPHGQWVPCLMGQVTCFIFQVWHTHHVFGPSVRHAERGSRCPERLCKA